MIRKQSFRYRSIAKSIGALGIVFLAVLSLGMFLYGDSRTALSTVSAQDVDEDALTKAYVDSAMEYFYDRGLGKTVERYGNPLSWDGERYLIVADAETHVLVSSPLLYLNGGRVDALVPGGQLGDEIESVTQQGHWFDAEGLNMLSGELEPARYFVRLCDGLVFMSPRFSGDLDTPLPAPPTPTPEPDDNTLTLAYVTDAIARYESDGLDSTVAYYNSEESIQGERGLRIYDPESQTMLASGLFPVERGESRLSFGPLADLLKFFEGATEEAQWKDVVGHTRNYQDVPERVVAVLHDGLVFSSSHITLQENVADATMDYVSRATARYDEEGLEATVAYYNSPESLEGNFYLFLIGADDIYIAHPIFPHLIGTDIKDVVGSDGQELGREIAQATEDGIWVEYLWPNPITRAEEQKTTWAIRHDGLIFASGYYTAGDEAFATPWKDADPREYTVDYVNRAIERYERDGLDSMTAYYNSVASFEGQWYLFAMDENDIYFVHSLLPRLIGTDIKDVVGSDGFELGKEIAKATEEGIWVEYLWPHPVTLKEVPKLGYAVRHDGLIFASGYYPGVEDPEAYTKDYVQQAIEYYDREGLEATVAYYNSQDSVDGQWYLILADGSDGLGLVHPITSILVGKDVRIIKGFIAGEPVGELIYNAPEEGYWFEFLFALSNTSETLTKHMWSIRHDGLIFTSGYYIEE